MPGGRHLTGILMSTFIYATDKMVTICTGKDLWYVGKLSLCCKFGRWVPPAALVDKLVTVTIIYSSCKPSSQLNKQLMTWTTLFSPSLHPTIIQHNVINVLLMNTSSTSGGDCGMKDSYSSSWSDWWHKQTDNYYFPPSRRSHSYPMPSHDVRGGEGRI